MPALIDSTLNPRVRRAVRTDLTVNFRVVDACRLPLKGVRAVFRQQHNIPGVNGLGRLLLKVIRTLFFGNTTIPVT